MQIGIAGYSAVYPWLTASPGTVGELAENVPLLEEVQAGVPPHNGLWGARDLRPPCGMCGPTHRSRLLKNACRVCLHLCKIKDAQVTLDSVSQKRCRTEERAYESACWKVIEFHAVMHHLLESG